jgi:hypothetical protein
VDVVACTDDERRHVCLFAVNSNREPVDVSLDLAEIGAGYEPVRVDTVCDTLDMGQPDVMNHWALPNRVQTVSRKLTGPKITLPALSVSAIRCGRRS